MVFKMDIITYLHDCVEYDKSKQEIIICLNIFCTSYYQCEEK